MFWRYDIVNLFFKKNIMTENQVEITPFTLKYTGIPIAEFRYGDKDMRALANAILNPDFFLFLLQCEEFEDYQQLELSKGIQFSKVKMFYDLKTEKIVFIVPREYTEIF